MTTTIEVMFELRHENAKLPVRGTPGSFGLDLFAAEREYIHHDMMWYDTGLHIEQNILAEIGMPLILPRGSIKNHRIMLTNSVGLMDTDYPGTIQAYFIGFAPCKFYDVGDKIAQLIFVPPCVLLAKNQEHERIPIEVQNEQRTGGYGSTGS
jgi:dUTPase